jgi:hypothetical protein
MVTYNNKCEIKSVSGFKYRETIDEEIIKSFTEHITSHI